MSSAIKEVFERACSHLVINAQLTKAIHVFATDFINKNKDHTEFFGSNLTGVHIVRFLSSDVNRWFEQILGGVNKDEIFEEISPLPVVNGKKGVFVVSSDPMNLSCIWLLHKLHNNSSMSVQQRHAAMMDVLFILQVKFLTSLLFRYFKYPADRAVAEATYAQLTNKFLIKTHGSWISVLRMRSEDILSNSGIHFETISKMESDKKIVDTVNDIQGRIRGMIKNIYKVFVKTYKEGGRIVQSSSVVEYDGVESLKDKTKGLPTYTNYIKSVVGDKNSFIRSELIRVVSAIMPSAPPKHIQSSLEYISDNYVSNKSHQVDDLISSVMVHSFSYLQQNRNTIRGSVDLANLLSRLKGVYTSSRSSDPDLLKLRQETESVIRRAVDTKTDSVIASVRTAVLLYIIARAYTMRHYTTTA